MKKIKTVYRIDRDLHRATEVVQEGWVLEGEGLATIKFDGTSTMVLEGLLYKRYDAKGGKTPPVGFVPAEAAPDIHTGHWPGWVRVSDTDPGDRWHREAFSDGAFEDGTYELIGPKIQKNKYGLTRHKLVKHGSVTVAVGRSREELIGWLEENEHEGLVFHHPDGRMAKLRRKDFSLRW
ncbi:hypothetical protein G6L37_34715 [Agrobacterium rubi]|nr:hypothetical protein [Agrobacterium rubi]NTF23721.1 hypothetical protein [Agrobacterium rubi]